MDWQNLETFSFGDNSDLANRLLELVLSGTTRATCWAESQGLLSAEIGKLMVVLDGQGAPKAVLKTIELTKRRFDEVDEAFAYDEGEGDRSLRYWREAHTRYFSRLGRYSPDMMLWCERFELVSSRLSSLRYRSTFKSPQVPSTENRIGRGTKSWPDRCGTPAGESGKDLAGADRGPDRKLSRRGRHHPYRGRLSARIVALFRADCLK
jgi:uncharacterized protein YhfF